MKYLAGTLVLLLLVWLIAFSPSDSGDGQLKLLVRSDTAVPTEVVQDVQRFYAANELNLTIFTDEPMVDRYDQPAAILVDFEDAGRPCEAIADALDLDDDAVAIVAGGTIRAPIFSARFNGIACGGHTGDCDSWEQPAFVALDVDNTDADLLAIVLAHELGHLYALRHQGDPACDDPSESSGRSQLMESGDMARLLDLQLEEFELTPAERESVRRRATD